MLITVLKKDKLLILEKCDVCNKERILHKVFGNLIVHFYTDHIFNKMFCDKCYEKYYDDLFKEYCDKSNDKKPNEIFNKFLVKIRRKND